MDWFKSLCDTPGVSGFEDEVQQLVTAELEPVCDEVWRDRMGNVVGLKRATKRDVPPRKLMLAGHVDEIGLMVSHIDEAGFIRFVPVGGLRPTNLISQPVIVHGRHPIKGVIAPWTQAGKSAEPQIDDLYIDLGLPADEVLASVELGDLITQDVEFRHLNDKVVTARNFDDRLGVYCMVEAMKRLTDPRVDVYAVSTVQEELGVRGAGPAAFAIEPDLGIAIDGSLSNDYPGIPGHRRHCRMGQGTGIYIMDKLTVGNPKWVAFLIELAQSQGITFQRNIGGGTDASAIQRTRLGAWSTTIGAPTRYMHSPVQMAHLDDIEATSALLVAAAEHAHELDLPQH